MNYLAHFLLSGEDTELLVGNFIADHWKGNQFEGLPPGVVEGIRLHRRIDTFTDNHSAHSAMRTLLRPYCGRYSGVVADVVADHFLAAYWSDVHTLALEQYATKVYGILGSHRESMPERSIRVLHYMEEYNWLCAYKHLDGFDRIMRQMAQRSVQGSPMERSREALEAEYEGLYQQSFVLWRDLEKEFAG